MAHAEDKEGGLTPPCSAGTSGGPNAALDADITGAGRYTLPPRVELLKPVDVLKVIEDDRYNS